MREEEAVTLAVAEEEKRKAVEAVIARRKARERERQAMETAHLQQQREEEAEARRQARAAEKAAKKTGLERKPLIVPSVAALLRRSLRGDEHHEPIHSRRFLQHASRAQLQL